MECEIHLLRIEDQHLLKTWQEDLLTLLQEPADNREIYYIRKAALESQPSART